MLSTISWIDFLSAFIVLFAVIDPIGIMPMVISLRDRGKTINAWKATLYAFGLMLIFFFMGDFLLRLFSVDVNSFAVAGALVIFLMALEMVLDIEIFKDNQDYDVDSRLCWWDNGIIWNKICVQPDDIEYLEPSNKL